MGVGLLIMIIGMTIGSIINSWTIAIISVIIGRVTILGGFSKFIGIT